MSLTISLFVQQNLWVPLSNFGLVAPTITACLVVILATIFYASKKTKRMPLPPMAKHGTFTVIKGKVESFVFFYYLSYLISSYVIVRVANSICTTTCLTVFSRITVSSLSTSTP